MVLPIIHLDVRSIAFSLRHVNTKMHDHKACFTALYAIRLIRQVLHFSVFAISGHYDIFYIYYYHCRYVMFCILCIFLNDFGRKVQIVSFRIDVVFCKLFVAICCVV